MSFQRSKARQLGLALVLSVLSIVQTRASTPSSQDVTVPTTDGAVVTVTWTGSSPPGTAGAGSTCNHTSASDPTQDHHVINLKVPAGAYSSVNVTGEFRISWDDQSGNDLVLTLEKDGAKINDSDNTNGAGTSFESVTTPGNPGAGAYDAVVCSFATFPTAQDYTGTLTLKATAKAATGGADKDTDGDGVLDRWDLCPGTASGKAVDADGCEIQATTGLAPRFQVHPSPAALGNDAGEPSIGFNPFTKRTMFISYTIALRETYPELDTQRKDVAGAQLPQSCNAAWEEKPGTLTTLNSLDPILFTDQATGRVFNSQLSGDNSLLEYSDDDGENWTPGQVGPPNGGADHQTIATGIYATALPTATWPATGAKRAVYYCSQSVAAAFCSRSDDGGSTFGEGNPFKDPSCAAGALHGHVKVSPVDGTVYVPDSSQCVLATGATADHVVAFRSTDNGVTFTAKPVPQSSGGDGSDPSIGVATDGTLYMCYTDADATVHMAVSKDKGDNWINAANIGKAKGVVQARFPQAIAGDPDRAACAFLGTSTAGNGNSLDFQGVWYGFVATTYDGGKTYHTVNVTPRDPVQGYGGVGPSGTNRNLLDFNDLQLDEQGRTLFAFADGCINGCVKDPSANAFAAKATVVRQTGGRTLFAKYDDVSGQATASPRFNVSNPVAPTAACAREDLSTRSNVLSNVVWNAPDTGGSPVTKYTVYRSLSPDSGFAAIGSTTGQTVYQDTATSPSVDKYYYKVQAENAQGTAPVGNTIALTVSTTPVDTCKVPGEAIIADPVGDSTGGEADMDIVSVSVAEPKAYAGYFVVTEKIANFTSGAPPASSFYPILFNNGTYFGLDSTQGPAAFNYGTYQDVGQGVLQFTVAGQLDSRSAYAADGTITFVVPASFFGNLDVGRVIAGWDARARVGSASATSRDTAGPSDYTIRGTDSCPDAGAVVLAALQADKAEGLAPLQVTFTVSGTPSSGKKLDNYTLDFGDGSNAVAGFFNNAPSVTVGHTYASDGVFRAKLTVTDATNTTSNAVEQTITVSPASSPTPTTTPGTSGKPASGLGDNHVVGALPLATLAWLGLLAALRRRR